MYAIIKTGGQQFKVAPGDSLTVDRLHVDEGANLSFDALLVGDGEGESATVQLGQPTVDGVKVQAEVVRHLRGEKIVVFKYKRRKNYRRRNGFRAALTEVRITGIDGVSA